MTKYIEPGIIVLLPIKVCLSEKYGEQHKRICDAAIPDYFIKTLKRKLISKNITVKYPANQILLATATSGDINRINGNMIDAVQFEFEKREIFKGRDRAADYQSIHTIQDLLSSYDERKKLFSSETALFDGILKIKNSKHYLQLIYLSSKHIV